jgi:hypothetical protein
VNGIGLVVSGTSPMTRIALNLVGRALDFILPILFKNNYTTADMNLLLDSCTSLLRALDVSAPFSLCSPQRHQQKLTVSDNG